ncbi:MAG TPA: BrnT family toxin [Allosphingosinicella sp.]|nr:BrnT family toxin [Allosphingosinicella sp.]
MKIEFDPAKREWTLRERHLDFARAGEIFGQFMLTEEDKREDYGEQRFLTYGVLDNQIVACVWTQRGEARRIISLRKADKHEREIYDFYKP